MHEEPALKRQRLQNLPIETVQATQAHVNGKAHDSAYSTKPSGNDSSTQDKLHTLEATANELQAALDLHTLPEVPDFCRLEPSVWTAKRLITYSHRLSYTSFAAQSSIGQQLFRPPAPQDWDFRASILHRLSGSSDKLKRMRAPERQPAVPQNEEREEQDRLQTTADPSKLTEVPRHEPKAPESQTKPAFQFNNSAMDFMLNEDMEEAEEEFSSSEEESE